MENDLAASIFSEEELKRDRTDVCEICGQDVKDNQKGIQCDQCNKWFHNSCVDLSDDFNNEYWCCPFCLKGGIRKKLDKNIFKKEEFTNFVDSLPYYCEKCDRAFENADDFSIHEIGHELATDGGKKKKSKKKKLVSQKNDSRSKKNNGKKKKSFRRRSAAGGKKKKN